MVLVLSLGEVLVKGRSGQATPVSHSSGISTPSTLRKILCSFFSGPMFRNDEQTLEKVFIDAIESEQIDIKELQICPGA